MIDRRAAAEDEADIGGTDVSLIVSGERHFSRETRTLRVFGVYNPVDRTAFLRNIAAFNLRENLWLEGSIGWFFGDGDDTIGRFSDRDFLYARLKLYF